MAKAAQDRSDYLDFERPVVEIENKIREFEELARTNNMEFSEEISNLHKKRMSIIREIFNNLTPWQKILLARHPKRPQSLDYIERVFPHFIELAGDRTFSDDSAIVTGPAMLGDMKVIVIAQHKGRDMKESIKCNWGSAHPEGYRKALEKMRLAEKFKLPIVALIDTKGAYPGVDAEERGQALAIAMNLREMSSLRTPIVCVVISEGGSGGALGIGVGDHLAMMENAYYSVISPEGCAAILWKDSAKAPEAAAALKLTPSDLVSFGIVDAVIPEPPGGAHRDPDEAAQNLKTHLISIVLELTRMSESEILDKRYEKYRKIGFYEKRVQENIKKPSEDNKDA